MFTERFITNLLLAVIAFALLIPYLGKVLDWFMTNIFDKIFSLVGMF